MDGSPPGQRGSALRIDAAPGMDWVQRIHVAGDLTRADMLSLQGRILPVIETTRASHLVIELGEVERIDIGGASVLIEAIHAGMKRDLEVLLCSPSPTVIEVFRIAGLENVLDHCCPTPDETERRLLATAGGRAP